MKLLMIPFVLFAFGAVGQTLNPIEGAKTALDERDLQNRDFSSECSVKPLEMIATGVLSKFAASLKGSNVVYKFIGSKVSQTTNYYSSPTCQGHPDIVLGLEGDFALHKDQRTNDGGKAIDMDYKTLRVSTPTSVGVTAANAVNLCGASDWSLNAEGRDASMASGNSNCLGIPLPMHDSNIYRIDDAVLYLGPQTKISRPVQDRPTNLDMQIKYTAR